jgi:hypothetical protein
LRALVAQRRVIEIEHEIETGDLHNDAAAMARLCDAHAAFYAELRPTRKPALLPNTSNVVQLRRCA